MVTEEYKTNSSESILGVPSGEDNFVDISHDLLSLLSFFKYPYIYVHIFIYTYTHAHVYYIYAYIYINRN